MNPSSLPSSKSRADRRPLASKEGDEPIWAADDFAVSSYDGDLARRLQVQEDWRSAKEVETQGQLLVPAEEPAPLPLFALAEEEQKAKMEKIRLEGDALWDQFVSSLQKKKDQGLCGAPGKE
jgi:hypothetical protein